MSEIGNKFMRSTNTFVLLLLTPCLCFGQSAVKSAKPTPVARIETLESKVATLESQVAVLRAKLDEAVKASDALRNELVTLKAQGGQQHPTSGPSGGSPALTAKAISPKATPQNTVSKANYDQISNGMSHDEVVKIVGFDGEEQTRSHIDGVPGVMSSIETVIYSWQNRDGTSMNAIFQNDKLIQKAQFGLR